MVAGINVGKLFPFGRKVFVIGTVREWNADPDNNLSVTAQRLVNAKGLAEFTVVGHTFLLETLIQYASRTRRDREIVRLVTLTYIRVSGCPMSYTAFF